MQPGDVVDGRFELEAQAGAGGMGTVFRARDRATGERVAVKVLKGEAREGRERFTREIRVLAGLRHPGIVRYVADGADATGMWLAMEWVEGETLGQRLTRLALTPPTVVKLPMR